MNYFEKNKGIRYIFKLENSEILELDYWLQPNSLREKWLNEIKSRLNKDNSYLNLKIANKNYLHLSELTKKLNSIIKDINDAYEYDILPSLDETVDINRKKLNELHEKFEEYGESCDHGDLPDSQYRGEYVHRLWLDLNEWIHVTETAMETGKEDFPNYSALVTVYPPYPGQILEEIDKLFLTTDYSWGQLYLGYNTLGKDYTHICFDNDVRVITNDLVKTQELYSSEAWLCFQQKSFFAKEFETQFYKWYETVDQEVQELIPTENLNKLALGRYFIGHLILNDYLLKFHPVERDWYTDIELQKRWNNEVFSKVKKVIKIELLDDLDAPQNQIIDRFIESSLENQWYPPHTPMEFDVFESDWPFLQIDFVADFEKMHQECIENDHLFVGHRQKDKHMSYSHEGWSALTLHGIRPDATEHYDQYGLTEPNYKWTEVCKYFPTCVQFLKKLGYRTYDRVRIMRLDPGGYIMPHSDGEGRIFGPLNIAINNPKGCEFYFQDWGKVPFKQGTGFFLDIGNVHAVYNNSDEPRYHFIVHGEINDTLIETAIDQLNTRENRICYGVYNQRNAIDSFSMYLRAKGATLFYLERTGNNVEIICRDEIHEILEESLLRGYEYCVIQSAGCTLRSFDYDREIRDFIKENAFGVAGHILSWPGRWLELHPQFFIVNISAWKEVGCPEFGEWCSENKLLPVIERSDENFHDDYTPLWVKYLGRESIQSEAGQGWKLLRAMFLNNWPVITLSEKLRFNKFYYYPEHETDKFENSIKTLTPYEGQNWNQSKIISDVKSIKDQIWLFNSETMCVTNKGKFDLVVNTASGFKLFDVFKNQKLNEHGKIIVYDFNPKSLRWYKHFHDWKNDDLLDCIRTFSEKDYFTWIGKKNYEYSEEDSFLCEYKKVIQHFGGRDNFVKYWKIFKKSKVKFVIVDLYKNPDKFANIFVGKGKKFVNLSNIFSTDATTFLYGHIEVQTAQQKCLASLYVVDPEIEISIFDFWGRHLIGKVRDLL